MNVIDEMLAVLQGEGWGQGKYCNEKYERCILGAWNHVFFERTGVKITEPYFTAVDHLIIIQSVIKDQFPDRVVDSVQSTIAQFNDHPDTTFGDVEKVLEKASIEYQSVLQ